MEELQRLFDAADAHGADTGEYDHTIGDLQDLLRSAWAVMSNDQRTALLAQASASSDVATADTHGEARRATEEVPTVVIDVDGGVVVSAAADRPVRVIILDLDVEGAEPQQLQFVDGIQCYVHDFDPAEVLPKYVADVKDDLRSQSGGGPAERDGFERAAS